MKEDKLIRGDAKLKKLPPERQREIWEKLNAPKETLASVAKWLREDGVTVSKQTLSEFCSWYSLRLTFEEAEQDTVNFQEFITSAMPSLSQERVAELGSVYFNLQAIKHRDPKLFLAFQTAQHRAEMDRKKFQQDEERLDLDRKKFQRETCELFVKWCQDERAKKIVESPDSHAQKIEKLGQEMFGDLWK